jgi:hypothetical protein
MGSVVGTCESAASGTTMRGCMEGKPGADDQATCGVMHVECRRDTADRVKGDKRLARPRGDGPGLMQRRKSG